MTRIAVVSDLHSGDGSKANDLCPDSRDEKHFVDNYLDSFENFVRTESLSADILIVPGDLSHRADPREMELAVTAIKRICNVLNISNDKVVFVPGNHDVDWSVLRIDSDDPTGLRHKQRYDPLLRTASYLTERHESARGSFDIAPFVCEWRFPEAYVMTFNSSWHDRPEKSNHHGLIPQRTVETIDKLITQKSPNHDQLRIFVVHHHVLAYSDPLPDEPDFSVMTNSMNLIQSLSRNHFDLLIHGHKHAPNVHSVSINGAFPLVVIGAGSFSAILDSRWSGVVNNQFHIIEVNGRDPKDLSAYGEVKSWTHTAAKGWKPSDAHNGVAHRYPFGSYLREGELLSRVEPKIREVFSTKDHIKWRDLAAMLSLEYVPFERVRSALEILPPDLSLTPHGENLDNLILLKES